MLCWAYRSKSYQTHRARAPVRGSLAVTGRAWRSIALHGLAQQTHRIRSRVRQSAMERSCNARRGPARRSKHAAHLRVRGSLLWSSHANLGVAGSGDAMLHTPRIRESARKWERLVMAVQYVAKLGDADTQRPAMAVAVCWARLGGAMRGAARHGKNIRLITGKLYE